MDISLASEWAMASEHATTPRATAEAELWHAHYKKFCDWWSHHQGQPIPQTKSFADWVQKQRYRKTKNWMPLGQQKLLEAAKFPFEAASVAAVPDNMAYAKKLVDFYLEHQHYAPTQTIGGAGLTKWVRNMRESKGTEGTPTAPDSACAAAAYLSDRIPGFSWEETVKAQFNVNWGLSHNGYPLGVKSDRDRRSDAIKARIQADQSAPLCYHFSSAIAHAEAPHCKMLHIGVMQMLGVRLVDHQKKQSGWVVSATESKLEYRTDDGRTLAVNGVASSQIGSVNSLRFGQGFLQVDLLSGSGGALGTLELDWVVADQFVGERHSQQGKPVETMKPKSRLLSTQSTRFKAYVTNIKLLQATIDEHVQKAGTPLHVGSGKYPVLFKFLEHAKRKFRRNEIGPAEALLLSNIKNCTIGKPSDPLPLGAWITEPSATDLRKL